MSNPAPASCPPLVAPWELPGSEGQPILGNTHSPPTAMPPVGQAVICHGFKGYMDYGFLPRLADGLARRGVIAHRFNFSHSGVTRDFATFSRPELFELDTWNRQVFDLTRVVDQRTRRDLPLVIFGHSRGGVTALLAASRLPADRISTVITAATPADAARLEPEQRDMLLRAGRVASPSGRTGQLLHVGRDWLAEIEADPQAHNPLLASAHLGGRAIHLHGDNDATIPVSDLSRFAAANPAAMTRVIAEANHAFNAPNPLGADTALPPQTDELFRSVFKALA